MSKASCMSRASWLALTAMLGAVPTAAFAQGQAAAPQAATPTTPATPAAAPAPAPAAEPEEDDGAIVVEGIRQRGSVEGDIKPDQTLSPEDIQALGTTNVGELLDALTDQIGADASNPPVTLLNGKRISGRQEIADIPNEAISRTEILPPEVALNYGYSANQRVINVVLVPSFRALSAQVGGSTSTKGGREGGSGNVTFQSITGDNRINISLDARLTDKLLESERDITPVRSSPQYSLGGNIYGIVPAGSPPGTAAIIDPALSTLAGVPVLNADVPDSAANGAPTLASFLPGANSPSVSDQGQFRTLQPRTRQYSANVTVSRAFGAVSGSANARLQRNESLSLQGLSTSSVIGTNGITNGLLTIPAGSPFSPFSRDVSLARLFPEGDVLDQNSKTNNAHLGLTLFGPLAGRWNWSFNGTYDYNNQKTFNNRGVDTSALQRAITARDPAVNPFGTIAASLLAARPLDTGNTQSNQFEGNVNVAGPLFKAPAGDARVTLTGNFNSNDQTSTTVRSGVTTEAGFHRNVASGRANLFLPITSRREGFLDAIGDLSLTANANVQDVSDFSTLKGYGFGFNWAPIVGMRLNGSINNGRQAPSANQLNAPVLVTQNVPVFDYRTGTTVFVNQTSGSNPNLLASKTRRINLTFNLQPFANRNWNFTAQYTNNRGVNTPNGFPSQSPDIEGAFPDRFIRDSGPDGIAGNNDDRLIAIDTRPVNFSQEKQSRLRYGFNLSFFLAPPPPPPPRGGRGGRGGADALADVPNGPGGGRGPGPGGFGGPGGGRGFGGPGGGGRGGGGNFGGPGNVRPRLQLELFHTWNFVDTVLIRPGLPIIDNLGGGATNGRGRPVHHVDANIGVNFSGFNIRAENTWDAATKVNGALGGGSTLRFGAQTNTNLRFIANFDQMPKLIKNVSFLTHSRVIFGINNVFDFHQKVVDASGNTPIQYEPDRVNPVGRTISLNFRKQF